MKKTYTLSLVLISFASLNGCVSERLNGRITTYHQPNIKMIGESYHMATLPHTVQQTTNGFAYQHYAQLVDAQLSKHGMNRAGSEKATYQVVIAYQQGSTQSRTRYLPDIGQTGVSFSQTYSMSNYRTTTYTPSYGIIGYHPQQYSLFPYYFCIYFYQSPFNFAMLKDKRAKLAYEVCAGSVALQSAPERAYPAMIQTIFNHFPAPNASSQSVSGWLAEPTHNNIHQSQQNASAVAVRWG